MKTFITTAALIAGSAPEKGNGRTASAAACTDSHEEIVTFHRIRKLPT